MVFADPDSSVYLLPAFDMAAVMLENQPLVEPAFRSGKGCLRRGVTSRSVVLHDRTLLPSRISMTRRFVAAADLDGVVINPERGESG